MLEKKALKRIVKEDMEHRLKQASLLDEIKKKNCLIISPG